MLSILSTTWERNGFSKPQLGEDKDFREEYTPMVKAGLLGDNLILSQQTIHHLAQSGNNEETLDKNFNFLGDPQSSVSSTDLTDPSWLDSVLGQSKQGVFSADFEEENNTWVELGDGDNITLDCRVFLKQEKTVGTICCVEIDRCWCCQISWLRHTALTSPDLLTVGNFTYTGDPRIQAAYSYPNNWKLMVTDLTSQDSGLYVCQISTHPPKELHTRVLVKGNIPTAWLSPLPTSQDNDNLSFIEMEMNLLIWFRPCFLITMVGTNLIQLSITWIMGPLKILTIIDYKEASARVSAIFFFSFFFHLTWMTWPDLTWHYSTPLQLNWRLKKALFFHWIFI